MRLYFYPHAQRFRALVVALVYRLVSFWRPVRPGSVILATNRASVLTDNLRWIEAALSRVDFTVRTFSFANRPRWPWRRALDDLRFTVAMAQTQYTVVDDFFALVYPIRLRPGTRLIQVWHALGALKRMGYSRPKKTGGPPATSVSHKNYTDVIVSADAIRADYAEAFSVSLDVVQALGAPRSDLFFDQAVRAQITDRLHARYPQLADRRVVLFAPTFRGPRKLAAHYPSDYVDLDRLGAALGDNDLLVIRMHPFVTSSLTIPPRYRDRMLDLSDYPEFNDLLLVTDLLITDYSSAIFDYALLDRPVVFYVPDLADYSRGRGFYYDFEEYAYGPVARDFDGLLGLLGTTGVDRTRLADFRAKFLDRCDGQATQRFIETILGG